VHFGTTYDAINRLPLGPGTQTVLGMHFGQQLLLY
jgi:hypothetical protein